MIFRTWSCCSGVSSALRSMSGSIMPGPSPIMPGPGPGIVNIGIGPIGGCAYAGGTASSAATARVARIVFISVLRSLAREEQGGQMVVTGFVDEALARAGLRGAERGLQVAPAAGRMGVRR